MEATKISLSPNVTPNCQLCLNFRTISKISYANRKILDYKLGWQNRFKNDTSINLTCTVPEFQIGNGCYIISEDSLQTEPPQFTSMPPAVVLPNVLELTKWPIPVRVNPHYKAAYKESSAWVESFKLLDKEALEAFHKFDFPLIVALAMPTASKEHLRLVVDMNQWFFLFDRATDNIDGEKVRILAKILMGVLRLVYSLLNGMAQSFGSILGIHIKHLMLRVWRTLQKSEFLSHSCTHIKDDIAFGFAF